MGSRGTGRATCLAPPPHGTEPPTPVNYTLKTAPLEENVALLEKKMHLSVEKNATLLSEKETHVSEGENVALSREKKRSPPVEEENAALRREKATLF